MWAMIKNQGSKTLDILRTAPSPKLQLYLHSDFTTSDKRGVEERPLDSRRVERGGDISRGGREGRGRRTISEAGDFHADEEARCRRNGLADD